MHPMQHWDGVSSHGSTHIWWMFIGNKNTMGTSMRMSVSTEGLRNRRLERPPGVHQVTLFKHQGLRDRRDLENT